MNGKGIWKEETIGNEELKGDRRIFQSQADRSDRCL